MHTSRISRSSLFLRVEVFLNLMAQRCRWRKAPFGRGGISHQPLYGVVELLTAFGAVQDVLHTIALHGELVEILDDSMPHYQHVLSGQ